MFGQFTRCNFKDGTKKLHTGTAGLETQISRKTQHELSFMLSFLPVHCSEKLASCHILTSMLAPSFVIACLLLCLHGFGLHSSGSSNSLLLCIAL